MAKFNVNQKVYCQSDGKVGVIRARQVINPSGKHTEVKYLVDFGGNIEDWKILSKKEIAKVTNPAQNNDCIIRKYEVGDGKIITMAAKTDIVKKDDYMCYDDTIQLIRRKGKVLTIGFSIYNGEDEYNDSIGVKLALHRCKHNPFSSMASSFSGEFNPETVSAIMDIKAKYIINNIEKFYRPHTNK